MAILLSRLLTLALSLVGALVLAPAPAHAIMPDISEELLAEIQGRWVNLEGEFDREVEVRGRDVYHVTVAPRSYYEGLASNQRYVPTPGMKMFTLTGSSLSFRGNSVINGPGASAVYRLGGMCYTNSPSGWRFTTERNSCFGSYAMAAHQYNLDPQYNYVEYRTLTLASTQIGAMIRPEVKEFLTRGGPKPASVSARLAPGARPAATPAQSATTTRIAPLANRATAPSAAQAPAPQPDTLSIPVTSEQEQREVAERERLNREQADFGTRQLAENEANRRAFEQTLRDREATIAKQKADYAAQLAAVEAERLRREREYAAKMAQWRADVEACKNGDKSKCGK